MGNFSSRGRGGDRDRGSRNWGRGGYGRGGRDDRQMFKAVCGNCGKDCQVPFRPTGDKPVYCSDCFEKMGDRGGRRSFDRPNDQYKAQFEAINAKLNEILNLLQPKPKKATEKKTPEENK